MTTTGYMTPPVVGKLLGISPETVVALIRTEQLRAANIVIDRTAAKRPRWRISPADVEAFLAARTNNPEPQVKKFEARGGQIRGKKPRRVAQAVPAA